MCVSCAAMYCGDGGDMQDSGMCVTDTHSWQQVISTSSMEDMHILDTVVESFDRVLVIFHVDSCTFLGSFPELHGILQNMKSE